MPKLSKLLAWNLFSGYYKIMSRKDDSVVLVKELEDKIPLVSLNCP